MAFLTGGAELGHMHYVSLGNKGYADTNFHLAGGGLMRPGPFNLQ